MDNLRRWLAARLEPPDRGSSAKEPRSAARTFAFVCDAAGLCSFITSVLVFFWGRSFASAVYSSGLVLLAFVFIGLNFDLQRRYSRESRRARAASQLATCNAHLTRAAIAVARGDESKFAAEFALATRTLAEAFDVATGYECRTAVMDIGLTSNDPEEGTVKVLCRNRAVDAGTREANLPEETVIKDNSDYLAIMRGAPEFYSNDLVKEHGYKNSHFDYPMKESEYPYRSTIVWPISGPHPDPSRTKPEIIGFLSVDSVKPRTFDRWLDVPTGRAVANAMYASLSQFRSLAEAEEGHRDE